MSLALLDQDIAACSSSRADRAYLLLRDSLITLQIKPGDPIDDVRVADEMALGRTPIREALKRLEGDRLVVAYPRRGTFATGVDLTDLAHINEVRLAMEPVAASRAAQRASYWVRAEMRELIAEIAAVEEPAVDRIELMRMDMAVHRLMYRAAGNPHLEAVLVRHHNLATRIFCLFVHRMTNVVDHVNEHAALLHAIIDGEADRAAELARAHLNGFEAGVRAVI